PSPRQPVRDPRVRSRASAARSPLARLGWGRRSPCPSWWHSRRPLPAAEFFDELQADGRNRRQVLPEQVACGFGEPLRRSGAVDPVTGGFVFSRLEAVLGEDAFDASGGGLGRVDNGHVVA